MKKITQKQGEYILTKIAESDIPMQYEVNFNNQTYVFRFEERSEPEILVFLKDSLFLGKIKNDGTLKPFLEFAPQNFNNITNYVLNVQMLREELEQSSQNKEYVKKGVNKI